MSTGKRYHWTQEQKQRMSDLYLDEWSMEEVGQRLGATRETIRYHLRRMQVPLRPRGMQTFRARAKYRGPLHGMWKGGRSKNHGYILLLRPDHPQANSYGYYPEHRIVVEEHLRGTDPSHPALENGVLRMDWIVHHRNGKRGDNRIENLEPRPRKEHHSWLHYHEEIHRLRQLLMAHGIDPR